MRALMATLPILAAPVLLARARDTHDTGRVPAATLDLTTHRAVELVRGAWRYHDAKPVDVAFRSPGPDKKPTGRPNRTWDIAPHAEPVEFDDSAWEVIDPATLDERRPTGKVCFCWYRFRFTVPDRIGNLDPSGCTIEFETVVDDYAEIWVDGRLPRDLGQRGGSVVAGFNAPNRVVVTRDARPGQVIQLAVFGINGPISAAPENFIWMRSAKLDFFEAGSSGVPAARTAARRIERLDPRLDRIVAKGATFEKVAGGFTWLEGPAWRDELGLVFSDIPNNRVFRWQRGLGTSVYLFPSGYTGTVPFTGREPGSNGLTFDSHGRLVLCEHGDRRVTRIEADGTRTVLADHYRGKRLNSPNDACFAPSGDLYITDPPFGLPGTFDDPARELPFSGVYRLSTSGELTLLVSDLRAPNGVAVAPDGRTLYVSNADPDAPVWIAWDIQADGTLANRRQFFDARRSTKTRPGLPDGMAVDKLGNVFAAGPGGVYVLNASGQHLGTLVTGVPTSNCTIGEGGAALYVTAATEVLRIRLAAHQ